MKRSSADGNRGLFTVRVYKHCDQAVPTAALKVCAVRHTRHQPRDSTKGTCERRYQDSSRGHASSSRKSSSSRTHQPWTHQPWDITLGHLASIDGFGRAERIHLRHWEFPNYYNASRIRVAVTAAKFSRPVSLFLTTSCPLFSPLPLALFSDIVILAPGQQLQDYGGLFQTF